MQIIKTYKCAENIIILNKGEKIGRNSIFNDRRMTYEKERNT